MHNVSVGLVYFNEIHQLQSCLESLFVESNRQYILELIVVFNSQKHVAAEKILTNFHKKYPRITFRLLPFEENNIGLARRRIVNASKGQYLCFTDPDCRVSSDWLFKFLYYFHLLNRKDKNCAALTGATKLSPDSPAHILNYFLKHKWLSLKSGQTWQASSPHLVDHTQTSNSFFVVKILRKVGNFSPAFSVAGEDLELGLRLGENGFHQYICPGPLVFHQTSENWKAWFLRCLKLGGGQYNSYLGYRFCHRAFLIFFVGLMLASQSFYFFHILLTVLVILLLNLKVNKQQKSLAMLLALIFTGVFYSLGLVRSYGQKETL